MANRNREEDAIQTRIWTAFRERAAQGVIGWHTPNGGHRAIREALDFALMGVVPGVPDLTFVRPGRTPAFIEVKTRKGRVSEEQERFRQRALAAGCEWQVARSEQDGIAAMLAMGIIN